MATEMNRNSRDESLRERYERDGFVFPLDLMPAAEAVRIRRRLEVLEARYSSTLPVDRYLRFDPHYLLPFVAELARDPRILDRVESLLGPDLMLSSTNLFLKDPGSADHITWHQDLYYAGLDGDDYLTLWLALSPITRHNGCMRYLRSSHSERFPHRDTFGEHNMLTRGQTVDAEIDKSNVVDVVLAPGEASIHHGWTAHASSPNRSDDRRVGLVIRYMSPRLRQTIGDRDYGILVRGEDRHRNFIQPPPPQRDFEPAAIARYEEIKEHRRRILYSGAERTGD